jgi:uncharacterized protein (DUF433 family)
MCLQGRQGPKRAAYSALARRLQCGAQRQFEERPILHLWCARAENDACRRIGHLEWVLRFPKSYSSRATVARVGADGVEVYPSRMIDWSTCPAVERDPSRVSGAWVFLGTRVPVSALFENLEDGTQVSQFVQWFPGVTLDQVRAVLEHAARSALAPA